MGIISRIVYNINLLCNHNALDQQPLPISLYIILIYCVITTPLYGCYLYLGLYIIVIYKVITTGTSRAYHA